MSVGRASAHKERAARLVTRLEEENASPERVLKALNEIACGRRNLNYTPHLVTALRTAKLHPGL